MNFFPLCTAIVWPTISGTTVERRDQVRSTFFSLRAFIPSICFCRYASINAPFLVERAINSLYLWLEILKLKSLLATAAHDECISPLVVARLVSAGRLSPWRYRMTSAGSFAFTTTVRMVHWVHGNSAVVRALTQPARPSSFSDGDVLVIGVAHLPNRRHAILSNLAGFTRRQFHQRVVAFFRDQLRSTASRTHHLRAFARL